MGHPNLARPSGTMLAAQLVSTGGALLEVCVVALLRHCYKYPPDQHFLRVQTWQARDAARVAGRGTPPGHQVAVPAGIGGQMFSTSVASRSGWGTEKGAAPQPEVF